MFAGAGDGDPFTGEGARLGSMEDGGGSGEVAAGKRGGAGHDLFGRAFSDDVSAQAPSPWSQIKNKVGAADRVFVVLDDEDGIAEVAQLFEGSDEAFVVSLMEADGGLVEDIENTA